MTIIILRVFKYWHTVVLVGKYGGEYGGDGGVGKTGSEGAFCVIVQWYDDILF